MRKLATSAAALACALSLAAITPALAQENTPKAPAASSSDKKMSPDRVAPPTNEHVMPPASDDRAAIPEKNDENTAAAPMMPGALASGSHRVSRIIGEYVVNDMKETIGKIDDIVIGPDDRAVYAVVSIGGVLGIGAKLVAVPYGDLKAGPDRTFILPGATPERLKSLPEFSYSHGA